MNNRTARSSVTINAPLARVWDYLTKPELIRTYLFGTQTETDWKLGSPIFFRGVWEGRSYEDKGKVLEFSAGHRLAYSYWSSASGLPDTPESYQTVLYEVSTSTDGTTVTVTHSGIDTEERRAHSEKTWAMVLGLLKKTIEER